MRYSDCQGTSAVVIDTLSIDWCWVKQPAHRQSCYEWFIKGAQVLSYHKLSYHKSCTTTSIVLPEVLFYCKCCHTVTVVLPQMLSYCKSRPTASVVLQQVFCNSKCCPTASIVLLQVLSYCECCPTGSVFLLRVLSWRSLHTVSIFILQKNLLHPTTYKASDFRSYRAEGYSLQYSITKN
jgi:hypothetical protein